MKYVLAATLVLSTSCASLGGALVVPPHPSAAAPESERRAYRERFDSIYRMRDGTAVDDPRALLPSLDDDTAASRALKDLSFNQTLVNVATVVGGVGVAGGAGGIIASGVVDEGQPTATGQALLVTGSIGILVAVSVLAVDLYALLPRVDEARIRADDTFQRDLDKTLALSPKTGPATIESPTTAAMTTTPETPTTTTTAAPTTAAPTTAPTTAAPVAEDPLPMHVVVREGLTKLVEFNAGPDLALAPVFVNQERVDEAGMMGGVFGTQGSDVFACFMSTFPARLTKTHVEARMWVRNGRVVDVKSKNACVATALRHGDTGSQRTVTLDVTIDHEAAPFVAPRCRRSLQAMACGGLFVMPQALEIARTVPNDALLLVAEGFREQGCRVKNDLALCKRKRIDPGTNADVLRSEVVEMETRYVRQLTNDDAIVNAALSMLPTE